MPTVRVYHLFEATVSLYLILHNCILLRFHNMVCSDIDAKSMCVYAQK